MATLGQPATGSSYEAPRVHTSIPGPESRRLLERQNAIESNARTYPRRLPLAVRRGAGSYLEDVDGNVFIDFLTGAGVLSLGHNHPEIVAAVVRQLHEYTHGLDFPTPIKNEFISLQLSALPEAMRDSMKVHFCGPTGANAIDAAFKLCKLYTGRGDIVAFHGAFHGSTHSTMAASGPVKTKEAVRNLMPGVHFFPYSYCYRCPLGLEPASCGTACASYLERVLADPNSGIGRPAAVVVEVVQGEGGVIPATREFMRRLREVTARYEILLIVDEVQTGCGRTGTWFAFEDYGIVPDVIVASKGLSGIGLPVAMMIYRRDLDVWSPGAHIGTFRGLQLAFAAGVAAFRLIQGENVLGNVGAQGAYLMSELEALRSRFAFIGDVRGKGLMIGIEIVDPESGRPDGEAAARLQQRALANGLILEVGGRQDAVVRLLPPLNIDRRTARQAIAILEKALAESSRPASTLTALGAMETVQ